MAAFFMASGEPILTTSPLASAAVRPRCVWGVCGKERRTGDDRRDRESNSSDDDEEKSMVLKMWSKVLKLSVKYSLIKTIVLGRDRIPSNRVVT